MKPYFPREENPQKKDNVMCNGCGEIIVYIRYPAIGKHHYHNKACFIKMCERGEKWKEKSQQVCVQNVSK